MQLCASCLPRSGHRQLGVWQPATGREIVIVVSFFFCLVHRQKHAACRVFVAPSTFGPMSYRRVAPDPASSSGRANGLYAGSAAQGAREPADSKDSEGLRDAAMVLPGMPISPQAIQPTVTVYQPLLAPRRQPADTGEPHILPDPVSLFFTATCSVHA